MMISEALSWATEPIAFKVHNLFTFSIFGKDEGSSGRR